MMTRKNFDHIATAILIELASTRDADAIDATVNVADRLSMLFLDENPRFDRARFLRDCGVDRYAPAHYDRVI